MDIKLIRQLLKENPTVVLVEEGHPPLVVRAWQPPEEPREEVPISARWPKAVPPAPVPQAPPVSKQDVVLDRLNQEILALREQIAQEDLPAGRQDLQGTERGN